MSKLSLRCSRPDAAAIETACAICGRPVAIPLPELAGPVKFMLPALNGATIRLNGVGVACGDCTYKAADYGIGRNSRHFGRAEIDASMEIES